MLWSEGEKKMQRLMHVPPQDNPTSTMLTPQASFMLQHAPLLAFGTLDPELRPWTALWGGEKGFSEPLGGGFIGTRTLVDGQNDPVVQALVGDAEGEEVLQAKDGGKLISGLAIDLVTRKRVKLAGKMVAGTVKKIGVTFEQDATKPDGAPETQDQIQLVTMVEQSMGNCPKYLNQYEISPAPISSKLLFHGSELTNAGKEIIAQADMFFLTTSSDTDMDTNHRGGPPGFVRILSSRQIIYPEYSGNRLYQSLGNLQTNPRIGLTFPNYMTGEVLYITGMAKILIEKDASTLLPGTNLAVQITLQEAKMVTHGLPFRGVRKLPSPYNPHVRLLASEGNIKSSVISSSSLTTQTAHLVRKVLLTPSIARFTFAVPEGIKYLPGQWIALDFKSELDVGYAHMRDDDPMSLNDDFVRTFTISSIPKGDDKQFDITIRKVGPVTTYLFQQKDRAKFEVPILGVGGGFTVVQPGSEIAPFVAGGVGITPLLGQLQNLDLNSQRLRLLWTAKLADIDFVVDTIERHVGLAACTQLFFTGKASGDDMNDKIDKLKDKGAQVNRRRIAKNDLEALESKMWYLCAGKLLRKEILTWLQGKEVVFENFDY